MEGRDEIRRLRVAFVVTLSDIDSVIGGTRFAMHEPVPTPWPLRKLSEKDRDVGLRVPKSNEIQLYLFD